MTRSLALVVLMLMASSGQAQETDWTLFPGADLAGPPRVLGQNEPVSLPPAPRFELGGADHAGATPVAWRYLYKRALLPPGNYADTRIEVQENLEELVAFTDSLWSGWQPWPADEAPVITFPDQDRTDASGRLIYYVFTYQVMDADGLVGVERVYGQNLAHFYISDAYPFVTVFEPWLGEFAFAGPYGQSQPIDVAGDQVLNFQWAASAESYGHDILAYRWGWDVQDSEDPLDPNWAVAPGDTPAHRQTPPTTFTSGTHTLTIHVWDSQDARTQVQIILSVVPIPDPANQLPVLLVDDVFDQDSQTWFAPDGSPLDNDVYRDAFWQDVLTGSGGVAGFEVGRDVVDTEDEALMFRDLVQYRAAIFTSRWVAAPHNVVGREFRPPTPYHDRFVWLGSYQRQAGNVLYCASRGQDNFLHETTYALPVVFTADEGDQYGFQDGIRVGFGQRTLPDGTVVDVGPTRYPYAVNGISVFDQMSPTSIYALYGTQPPLAVRDARRSPCVALKNLVLDPAFAERHLPDGAPFQTTIPTDAQIDWRDLSQAYYDTLTNPYVWGNDEFYEDAMARSTPWTPQACSEAPDGLCVEPMFRSLARFDWIRRQHLQADPNDTWPDGYYDEPLSELCGEYALNGDETSALTSDKVVGLFAHKTAPDKPSRAADVIWGFDPYRFDHLEMKRAIRWVLGEHFGLAMLPRK